MKRYDVIMLVTAAVLVATVLVAGVVSSPSRAQAPAAGAAPTYVGAEKCKMCHMREYRSWSATGKAKAWDMIKDAPDREKCLPCHTTGFGRPGGFTTFEATPHLAGVQCEVCHGPGSAHTALPMSERDPAKRRETINRQIQDCRVCHNPHIPDKAAALRGDTSARR